MSTVNLETITPPAPAKIYKLTLELTEKEAVELYQLTRYIGGCSLNSIRKVTDDIGSKLHEAGNNPFYNDRDSAWLSLSVGKQSYLFCPNFTP